MLSPKEQRDHKLEEVEIEHFEQKKKNIPAGVKADGAVVTMEQSYEKKITFKVYRLTGGTNENEAHVMSALERFELEAENRLKVDGFYGQRSQEVLNRKPPLT